MLEKEEKQIWCCIEDAVNTTVRLVTATKSYGLLSDVDAFKINW